MTIIATAPVPVIHRLDLAETHQFPTAGPMPMEASPATDVEHPADCSTCAAHAGVIVTGPWDGPVMNPLAAYAHRLFDRGLPTARIAALLGVDEQEAVELWIDDVCAATAPQLVGMRPGPIDLEGGRR